MRDGREQHVLVSLRWYRRRFLEISPKNHKDVIAKSFDYVTGLEMVFKTNVTRSQRNGKSSSNMKCHDFEVTST